MFALFAGSTYYPVGGWHDLDSTAFEIKELLIKIQKLPREEKDYHFVIRFEDGWADIDWWHIVNLSSGDLVTHQNDPEILNQLADYEGE